MVSSTNGGEAPRTEYAYIIRQVHIATEATIIELRRIGCRVIEPSSDTQDGGLYTVIVPTDKTRFRRFLAGCKGFPNQGNSRTNVLVDVYVSNEDCMILVQANDQMPNRTVLVIPLHWAVNLGSGGYMEFWLNNMPEELFQMSVKSHEQWNAPRVVNGVDETTAAAIMLFMVIDLDWYGSGSELEVDKKKRLKLYDVPSVAEFMAATGCARPRKMMRFGGANYTCIDVCVVDPLITTVPSPVIIDMEGYRLKWKRDISVVFTHTGDTVSITLTGPYPEKQDEAYRAIISLRDST